MLDPIWFRAQVYFMAHIYHSQQSWNCTFQGCIYISNYKSLWLGDLKFHHKIFDNVITGQGHFSSFNIIMKYFAYDIGNLQMDLK